MDKIKLRDLLLDELKKISSQKSLFDLEINDNQELIKDLGIKSTKIIDFVLEVESVFDIEIDPDEMDNMFTVGETVETIFRLIEKE